MDKSILNKEIHEKIINSSKIFLQRESDNNISLLPALEWIEEIQKDNLNDVTEIYIFEEGFGNTETKLKNTIVHLITSTIACNYTEDNLSYLKNIILIEDNKKSDIALDYFLKIGAYQKNFSNEVLNFIDENYNTFTKNKLNTSAFYLASVYRKNERNMDLFNAINELHSQKYPSQKNENSNNSIKKEQTNLKYSVKISQKKPWWKIW
jgi:hypothetical protein